MRTLIYLQYVCQQLMSKCKNERDRMPAEKRAMFTQLPKFLEALKQEILIEDSPIWDVHFKPPLGLLLQRKRDNSASVSSDKASTSGTHKKYSEPLNKKFKRDHDGDDISDEAVIKAIKRINDSNYTNKIDVSIYMKKILNLENKFNLFN